MKTQPFVFGIAMVLLVGWANAQEPPMSPEPQKQHEWLQQFVGDWKTVSEGSAGPDQPAIKCEGTARYHMLGKFWVVSEIEAEIAGSPMHALQSIGYDAKTDKYIGTWIDSVMPTLWRYEGSLDDSGKILTVEAEGPDFSTPGKTTKYRDVYEIKSKDHIVTTSSALTADGKWVTFMRGDMTRQQ